MYHNMWTNGPKECDEFADYAYDEHFGRPIPSYLEREQFRGYILGRAEKSGVKRLIQFNTAVRDVCRHQDGQFFVTVEDLQERKSRSERFDYVVVASGHFSVPDAPHFDGMDGFPGRICHSHDFRNAEEFAGQDVLVIGGRWSAEDIALQLYKFGAKSITISYRTRPMGFAWPAGIVEVPLLAKIQGKTAIFRDGTEREVDSVILCTGYKHHFPFLAHSLRLVTGNRPYPGQLYKGIFFQDEPNLLYLGMQDVAYSAHFDAQAWYSRDVILGRIPLPDAEARLKDIAHWKAREEAEATDLRGALTFLTAYLKDLLSSTDFPPIDLDAIVDMTIAYFEHKTKDILSYRDQLFTSWKTGTQAVPNPLPWVQSGRV